MESFKKKNKNTQKKNNDLPPFLPEWVDWSFMGNILMCSTHSLIQYSSFLYQMIIARLSLSLHMSRTFPWSFQSFSSFCRWLLWLMALLWAFCFCLSSCFCRRFSESSDKGWFQSLFVHKVDARKDAHSNLLSKKETSNLYKIQCRPIHIDIYLFIYFYFILILIEVAAEGQRHVDVIHFYCIVFQHSIICVCLQQNTFC